MVHCLEDAVLACCQHHVPDHHQLVIDLHLHLHTLQALLREHVMTYRVLVGALGSDLVLFVLGDFLALPAFLLEAGPSLVSGLSRYLCWGDIVDFFLLLDDV